MKKYWLTLSMAVALSSVAGAQKYIGSPAQDLFDQASFFLDTQYFGPSTINMTEHIAKYQTRVDEACEKAQKECSFETIEPLLSAMFSDLNDAHAYYLSASAVAQENANRSGQAATPTPRVGITSSTFCDTPTGVCETDASGNLTSKLIGDRFVSNVVNNSPAQKAGLQYGDRWIGYNDTLFANNVSSLEIYNKYLSDFTTKVRAGESLKVSILRGKDRQKIDVTLKGEIFTTSEVPTLVLQNDGVAIVTYKDYQVGGVAQRMHDLLREASAKGAKSVIFNQRTNGGGSALEMLASVGAFIEKPSLMQWRTRYNVEKNVLEFGYASGNVSVTRGANATPVTSLNIRNPVVFSGPIAVLVDSGCASGCEYFASYIQKAKRGVVIGSPTVGIGNTNTARFSLANGGAAGMPTIQAFWKDDSTSLPAQVKPDMLVENAEFKLFNTGVDEVMNKALESVGVKTLQAPSNSIEIKVPFAPIPTFGFDAIISVLEQSSRKPTIVTAPSQN